MGEHFNRRNTMISNHFFSRYGLALVMQENHIVSENKITSDMLNNLIQNGMNHFRLQPIREDNGKVEYQFAKELFLTSNPKYIRKHCDEGFFLSPNAITIDKAAYNSWKAMLKLKNLLKQNIDLSKSEKATMSIMPMTSKFNNGKMSQAPPNTTFLEACLCMIVTISPDKPSLHITEKQQNGAISYLPTAIIPDLDLEDLIKFISVFKVMKMTQTEKLMIGGIQRDGKKVKYTRPRISFGNFPYAPRKRRELSSAALLGAIGWFAKQVEYPNTGAEEVLEKLKQRPMYIISYGQARSIMYNHYVVDMAKNNQLNTVIDALERITVYASDEKNFKGVQQKRDNFFLFASRFLQLFDKQSFREFISIRGEYPNELTILLKTYFGRVMKIEKKLIESAAVLGKWLNRTAYFTAKEESKEKQNDDSEIRKAKAKILVELESAAFSAKKATDLVAQVITRACRMSNQDAAPSGSQPFIEAVIAGELGENEKENLENAKNMIVVFSRVRGSKEEPYPEQELIEEEEGENNEIELSEDEQE